jgi:phosphonate transport system substrate-binding protein
MQLVFGIAAHAASKATAARNAKLAAALGDLVGRPISHAHAQSYDALAAMLHQEKVNIAWLPPIPFMALERANIAFPLVSHQRGGKDDFEAVLIVRSDSPIRTLYGLQGKRAAWVDPLSASGYVLPRIQLAALGIDPRVTFAAERFYGSHEAVVRAVVGGAADFGATFANIDARGQTARGGWSDLEGAAEAIRVCARFGAIPADVIAVHSSVDAATCEALTRGLIEIAQKETDLVRSIFGVDEFVRWVPASYEPLRRAMSEAASRGLLDAVETRSGDVSRY